MTCFELLWMDQTELQRTSFFVFLLFASKDSSILWLYFVQKTESILGDFGSIKLLEFQIVFSVLV